ncbi:hypothetical protein [Bradyrhizobium sp. CCGB01]|uniref:hypothetical protein n=1 Tax=Bradyrhizobium sp. CCGB01 TaxID=2949634 RepID=UPI0020B1E8B3|nr:hypothetical protein [Bradyrhizobium sp. CCGB01]MCP3405467.1 hypothetical protein [Bradyrhizobium sp. CCGB01]
MSRIQSIVLPFVADLVRMPAFVVEFSDTRLREFFAPELQVQPRANARCTAAQRRTAPLETTAIRRRAIRSPSAADIVCPLSFMIVSDERFAH